MKRAGNMGTKAPVDSQRNLSKNGAFRRLFIWTEGHYPAEIFSENYFREGCYLSFCWSEGFSEEWKRFEILLFVMLPFFSTQLYKLDLAVRTEFSDYKTVPSLMLICKPAQN